MVTEEPTFRAHVYMKILSCRFEIGTVYNGNIGVCKINLNFMVYAVTVVCSKSVHQCYKTLLLICNLLHSCMVHDSFSRRRLTCSCNNCLAIIIKLFYNNASIIISVAILRKQMIPISYSCVQLVFPQSLWLQLNIDFSSPLH